MECCYDYYLDKMLFCYTWIEHALLDVYIESH